MVALDSRWMIVRASLMTQQWY